MKRFYNSNRNEGSAVLRHAWESRPLVPLLQRNWTQPFLQGLSRLLLLVEFCSSGPVEFMDMCQASVGRQLLAAGSGCQWAAAVQEPTAAPARAEADVHYVNKSIEG